MFDFYTDVTDWLKTYPFAYEVYALSVILLFAWLVDKAVKSLLIKGVGGLVQRHILKRGEYFKDDGTIRILSKLIPLGIVYRLIPKTGLHPDITSFIKYCLDAVFILIIARVIAGILNFLNYLWNKRHDAHVRPIKGYLQVVKIVIYCIAVIFILSHFLNKNPIIIMSGMGAMAAVLMLIFQDTLLSLVASVMITSNRMIRIGDWIEMPQSNADGNVIDIALHAVSVQNWDKTVTAIPTKKFLSEPFKNWRGMEQSGGRRIKRSIYLDQTSVHFLTHEEEEKLLQFEILGEYLKNKRVETGKWNEQLKNSDKAIVNFRRLTNIGTFRAYIQQYLLSNPNIHHEMTLLVRQLDLTPKGLPIELYCFSNDTRWAVYENIQSDIFDHLLAILPEFGLRVFQEPSGSDVARAFSSQQKYSE